MQSIIVLFKSITSTGINLLTWWACAQFFFWARVCKVNMASIVIALKTAFATSVVWCTVDIGVNIGSIYITQGTLVETAPKLALMCTSLLSLCAHVSVMYMLYQHSKTCSSVSKWDMRRVKWPLPFRSKYVQCELDTEYAEVNDPEHSPGAAVPRPLPTPPSTPRTQDPRNHKPLEGWCPLCTTCTEHNPQATKKSWEDGKQSSFITL